AVELGHEALELAQLGDPVPQPVEVRRSHPVERGIPAVELGPPVPVRLRRRTYDECHVAHSTGSRGSCDTVGLLKSESLRLMISRRSSGERASSASRIAAGWPLTSGAWGMGITVCT